MATKEVCVCAPCKSRGISAKGVRYCVICQEQLCKACIECHKAFKATKHHHLVQAVFINDSHVGENIPICADHPKKHTEFYCDNHDKFLCSHCLFFSDKHKNCPKIIEVECAGKYFLERNLTEKIKESSIQLVKSAENAVKEITKGNQCTSESLQDMRCEIEMIRKKMLEAFDRQTNHIIGTISKDILQNRSNCERAMLNFEKFSKRITENDIFLKTAIDDGDTAGVFRGALTMVKQFDHFNREVEWTKTYCSRLKVTFEKSDLFQMLETDQNPLLICDVQHTTFSLPDLSSKTFEKVIKAMTSTMPAANALAKSNVHGLKKAHNNRPNKGMKDEDSMHTIRNNAYVETQIKGETIDEKQAKKYDIELSYACGVDIKMPDGDEQPCYNGIVCLEDESLVLSDFKTSRIIMVKNNTYVSDKRIEFKPGNLALFNNFIFVCLLKTNRLLMIKIDGNFLKEYRYLNTRFHPKCVKAIDNERIIVSSKNVRDEWSLEVKTLNGQTWRSDEINVDIHGYQEGSRLTVQPSPDSSGRYRIIMFFEKSNSLKSLHKNGKLEEFCSDIEKTTALLTDHLGFVFVTRYPGEVQVFTPDGHFVTSIYRSVMHRVTCAAFNRNSDKLFITTNKDAKIHVIDIKRQTCI